MSADEVFELNRTQIASSMTDRSQTVYTPVLRTSPQTPQLLQPRNQTRVDMYSISRQIQITFNLNDMEYDDTSSPESNSQQMMSLLSEYFSLIQFFGFSLNGYPSSPPIPLLNITNALSKVAGMKAESIEAQLLYAYALEKARKHTQASEIYRRCSAFFQSSFSFTRAAQCELLSAECLNSSRSQLNEKVHRYARATKLFSQTTSQLNQPTKQSSDAYTNLLRLSTPLTKFLLSQLDSPVEPIRVSVMKSLQFLLETLGCTVSNSLQDIIREVIRTFPSGEEDNERIDGKEEGEEFSNNLSPLNRRKMISEEDENSKDLPTANYQGASASLERSPMRKGDRHQRQQGISNFVIDEYNKFFEVFVNLLSSCSASILRDIFNDVLTTALFKQPPPPPQQQMLSKPVICRIMGQIAGICQGDLLVDKHFVRNMMGLLKKDKGNARQSVMELWEILKDQLLSSLDLQQANEVITLIAEKLQEECSNRETSLDNNPDVHFWVELVFIVLQRQRRVEDSLPACFAVYARRISSIQEKLDCSCLVSPLLRLLDYFAIMRSASSANDFKMVWNVLVEVILSSYDNEHARISLSSALERILDNLRLKDRMEPLNLTQICTLKGVLEAIPHVSQRDQCDPQLKLFPLEKSISFDETTNEKLKDLLRAVVEQIPHSTYEETFQLFEILVARRGGSFDSEMVEDIVMALTDRFTMRGKWQKKAVQTFIDVALKVKVNAQSANECFSQIIDSCVIDNVEPSCYSNEGEEKKIVTDSKRDEEMFDGFVCRLDFFAECLSNITGHHFRELVGRGKRQRIEKALCRLIESQQDKVRLKGLSIVKNLLVTFVGLKEEEQKEFSQVKANIGGQEKDKGLGFAQIQVTKMMLVCLKACLDEGVEDPKVQFNSLELVDKLFAYLFRGPDVKAAEEYSRNIRQQGEDRKLEGEKEDLLNSEFIETDVLDIESDEYLRMRLREIRKLWPLVESLAQSPWSNIRSLVYSVICEWVRVDVGHYILEQKEYFLGSIFPFVSNLLSSSESECRTGALNIIGSMCGLSYDFASSVESIHNFLPFFRRHSQLIPNTIWVRIFEIQSDWDVANQAAAMILIQLSAPKDLVLSRCSSGHLFSSSTRIAEAGVSSEEFFWLECSSSSVILEMVQMFRGSSSKQFSSLWIDREAYNSSTSSYLQEIPPPAVTETITYTMNEEEDAGVAYGYFNKPTGKVKPHQQQQSLPSSDKHRQPQQLHVFDIDLNDITGESKQLGIIEVDQSDENDDFERDFDLTYEAYKDSKKAGKKPPFNHIYSATTSCNEPSSPIRREAPNQYQLITTSTAAAAATSAVLAERRQKTALNSTVSDQAQLRQEGNTNQQQLSRLSPLPSDHPRSVIVPEISTRYHNHYAFDNSSEGVVVNFSEEEDDDEGEAEVDYENLGEGGEGEEGSVAITTLRARTEAAAVASEVKKGWQEVKESWPSSPNKQQLITFGSFSQRTAGDTAAVPNRPERYVTFNNNSESINVPAMNQNDASPQRHADGAHSNIKHILHPPPSNSQASTPRQDKTVLPSSMTPPAVSHVNDDTPPSSLLSSSMKNQFLEALQSHIASQSRSKSPSTAQNNPKRIQVDTNSNALLQHLLKGEKPSSSSSSTANACQHNLSSKSRSAEKKRQFKATRPRSSSPIRPSTSNKNSSMKIDFLLNNSPYRSSHNRHSPSPVFAVSVKQHQKQNGFSGKKDSSSTSNHQRKSRDKNSSVSPTADRQQTKKDNKYLLHNSCMSPPFATSSLKGSNKHNNDKINFLRSCSNSKSRSGSKEKDQRLLRQQQHSGSKEKETQWQDNRSYCGEEDFERNNMSRYLGCLSTLHPSPDKQQLQQRQQHPQTSSNLSSEKKTFSGSTTNEFLSRLFLEVNNSSNTAATAKSTGGKQKQLSSSLGCRTPVARSRTSVHGATADHSLNHLSLGVDSNQKKNSSFKSSSHISGEGGSTLRNNFMRDSMAAKVAGKKDKQSVVVVSNLTLPLRRVSEGSVYSRTIDLSGQLIRQAAAAAAATALSKNPSRKAEIIEEQQQGQSLAYQSHSMSVNDGQYVRPLIIDGDDEDDDQQLLDVLVRLRRQQEVGSTKKNSSKERQQIGAGQKSSKEVAAASVTIIGVGHNMSKGNSKSPVGAGVKNRQTSPPYFNLVSGSPHSGLRAVATIVVPTNPEKSRKKPSPSRIGGGGEQARNSNSSSVNSSHFSSLDEMLFHHTSVNGVQSTATNTAATAAAVVAAAQLNASHNNSFSSSHKPPLVKKQQAHRDSLNNSHLSSIGMLVESPDHSFVPPSTTAVSMKAEPTIIQKVTFGKTKQQQQQQQQQLTEKNRSSVSPTAGRERPKQEQIMHR